MVPHTSLQNMIDERSGTKRGGGLLLLCDVSGLVCGNWPPGCCVSADIILCSIEILFPIFISCLSLPS